MDFIIGDTYVNSITQDVWICSKAGKSGTAEWEYQGRRTSDMDDNNIWRPFTANTSRTTVNKTKVTTEVGENPFGELDSLLHVHVDKGTAYTEADPYNVTTEIDPSKTYRYTVYVKVMDKNSNQYFGIRRHTAKDKDGNYPPDAYITTLNGTDTLTGYFASSPSLDIGKWYLIVGYVVAYNTSKQPDDNGIYDITSKLKIKNCDGRRWREDITSVVHTGTRILYIGSGTYAGDSDAYIYDMRFDVMDGNEPSIEDLLHLDTSTKYKGQWTAGIVYHEGDVVYKDGNSYGCLVNNQDATFDESKWDLVAIQGRSISGVREWYKLTSTNKTPEVDDTWVKDTPPAPTTGTPYLWNYEETLYSYGDSDKTEPHL